jgi:HAMP domain-containing protein
MSDINEGGERKARAKHMRSRILYEITILLVVVLIASGLATFFLVRGSQERLIGKSKDKLVDVEASTISSGFDYIAELYTQRIIEVSVSEGPAEIAKALLNKQSFNTQVFVNGLLQEMVDSGMLGINSLMLIMTRAPGLVTEPILYSSSDASLIYNWEVPDYLTQAIDDGVPYLYMEDGIPELGLEGEQLITIRSMEDPTYNYTAGFVGIKPMHDEVAAINNFYSSERDSISLTLALVVVVSIIVVMLIIFFVLSYLIRKRITEPVEELAAAAEEVMTGNLDVKITVHEGGDFEGLERAFKEMVESFRKYLAKATGDK